MPPFVRPLLFGFAAAFAVALLLGFVGLGYNWLMLAGIGVIVAGAVSRLGSNRAEQRLDGAGGAAAASLTAPPGGALLVVTREGMIGMALGMDVFVDGRPAAQLRSPRGVVLPVEPGAHEVAAVDPSSGTRAALPVELAPGEVAFVALRVALGRNGLTLARAADPSQGRAAVGRVTLVAPDPAWGGRAEPAPV